MRNSLQHHRRVLPTENADITERIKDNLKKNVLFYNYKISMSSGIASYQRDENYKELIHRADQAMYESKKRYKESLGEKAPELR